MRQAFGIHPFGHSSWWHEWAGCYHGQMQKRNEASRSDDCGVIACIVRAVRAGDDRLIEVLLRRFAQHAEIESLFRLRDALDSDVGPAPGPSAPAARSVPWPCRRSAA